MPENLGMRRGIVIDNKDPKMMGRVKVFIPGVYPDEYAKAPEMLPWAEPAMGIFGGSWANPAKGLNTETGVCSAPHAGANGDGAQVWVFFEANDIRFPVYFAVAQSGSGWFANHNNQHVIKSDNVTVVVDEFDNHYEMPKKAKVPSETAAENFKGDPEELNEKIDALGGVGGLSEDLNGMGGSTGFSKLSEAFGGIGGIAEVAESMGGSLNSFSNFLDQTGGVDKLSSTVNAAGGSDAFFNALTGNGNATSNSAIEASYGSKMDFIAATAQLGGVENLKKVASKSGSLEKMCSNLSSANGSAGVGHLASMMNNLGSPQQFKDFFNELTDGVKSLESIAASMASAEMLKKKQQEMAGELSDKEDPVTVCDSYTTKGNAAIKAGSKSSMKTRLAVRIEAAKNCAVDLHITGHVNLHIEGNVFREIIGNIYDTHIGDHYIYHKGSTFDETKGRRTSFIDNILRKVTKNEIDIIEGSRSTSVNGMDSVYSSKSSKISTSSEDITLQNRVTYTKNESDTVAADRFVSTLGDLTLVGSNVYINAKNTAKTTANNVVTMAMKQLRSYSGTYSRFFSAGNTDIESIGVPIVVPGAPDGGDIKLPESPGGFSFNGPVNIAGGLAVNADFSEFASALLASGASLGIGLAARLTLSNTLSSFGSVSPTFSQLNGVNLLSSTSVNSLSLTDSKRISTGTIINLSLADIVTTSVAGNIVNFSLDGSIGNFASIGIINSAATPNLAIMPGVPYTLTLSAGAIVNTSAFDLSKMPTPANSIINNTGTFDQVSAPAGSIVNNAKFGSGQFIADAVTEAKIVAPTRIKIAHAANDPFPAASFTPTGINFSGAQILLGNQAASAAQAAIGIVAAPGAGGTISINESNLFVTTINATTIETGTITVIGNVNANTGDFAANLTLSGRRVLTVNIV